MPQRAIIEEKSGSQAVQAFRLSEEEWKGIIEASRAKILKLPCCGVTAQPRAPENMVRHFAHPPYTLQYCSAKTADVNRDSIIAAVAKMAEDLNWSVVTEVKFDQHFCDLVCSITEFDVSIGFEFETGTRPNDELNVIDDHLHLHGLTQLHWFFKKGRRGGYPTVANSYVGRMVDREAIDTIVKKCRTILDTIERTLENASALCESFDKRGLQYDLQTKDGIPAKLTVKLPESDEVHQIHIFSKNYKISSPTVSLAKQQLDRGERIGAEQKTIIQIVDENLANGVTTWWDDYPDLMADSFSRLRRELEKNEQSRRERYVRQQQWHETKRRAEPSAPKTGARLSGQHKKGPHTEPELTHIGTSFADMRLKSVRCLLLDFYGDEYSEELLDSAFDVLGNKTPRQIAFEKSQAINIIETAFGYRDIRGKPLRRIPITEL